MNCVTKNLASLYMMHNYCSSIAICLWVFWLVDNSLTYIVLGALLIITQIWKYIVLYPPNTDMLCHPQPGGGGQEGRFFSSSSFYTLIMIDYVTFLRKILAGTHVRSPSHRTPTAWKPSSLATTTDFRSTAATCSLVQTL